jgi:hypothetical protein
LVHTSSGIVRVILAGGGWWTSCWWGGRCRLCRSTRRASTPQTSFASSRCNSPARGARPRRPPRSPSHTTAPRSAAKPLTSAALAAGAPLPRRCGGNQSTGCGGPASLRSSLPLRCAPGATRAGVRHRRGAACVPIQCRAHRAGGRAPRRGGRTVPVVHSHRRRHPRRLWPPSPAQCGERRGGDRRKMEDSGEGGGEDKAWWGPTSWEGGQGNRPSK